MTQNYLVHWLLSLCFLVWGISAHAQAVITGTVKDFKTGEPLMGVAVALQDGITGTTTDKDGEFSLITDETPPFKIDIYMLGYERRSVDIIVADQDVHITLAAEALELKTVVVAASRIEEAILRSPVSIEKQDAIELRTSPAFNAYAGLSNLKGVQVNIGGVNSMSVNTRGFAEMQNWRFVELVDNVPNGSPGLNYPLGALSTPIDLDVLSMELVPGANSALYGANAFNGMLVTTTKDPFYFKGLSAEIKSGIGIQNSAATGKIRPFNTVSLRYAYSFKDKFALKVVGSVSQAKDWEANDESYYISNAIVNSGMESTYQNMPRTAPNFDAVSVLADDAVAMVDTGGAMMRVNRSGIRERDLVNYNQQVYKLAAAFQYRINNKLKLSYDGNFRTGDLLLRYATVYAGNNYMMHTHQLRLESKDFFVRSSYVAEDAGGFYNTTLAASYMQTKLKSNAAWSADYGAAFRGTVTGVAAHDHAAARAYADRDIPGADSDAFKKYRDSSFTNSNARSGGSLLVNRSSIWYSEGQYNFTPLVRYLDLQAGGTFRLFNLASEGVLFNDGALGYNKPIQVKEYGGYVQAGKKLFDEKLLLRGSIRADKNQNFEVRVTPRASAVFAFGKDKEHNIRASYQTGFRNPAATEMYYAVNVGYAFVVGGLQDNIEHLNWVLPMNNPNTGDAAGTVVNGTRMLDTLYTVPSFQRYAQTHNTADLVRVTVPYLKQERITAIELGYRGLIGSKLIVDASYYYSEYHNLATRITAYSPAIAVPMIIYSNISTPVFSQGVNVGGEYLLPKDYKLGMSYGFMDYNAKQAQKDNPAFAPSFNAPKHRVNASLSNRNVWNGVGFSVKYRWWSEYLWQSYYGQGTVKSQHIVDAAVMYTLPKLPVSLKLGGTNLLGKEYLQVYAGPNIGTQVYIGIVYDAVANQR